MRWQPRTYWVVAGLLLMSCRSADRGPLFELKEEEWTHEGDAGVHLTTDHFDIYTTIKDRELRVQTLLVGQPLRLLAHNK